MSDLQWSLLGLGVIVILGVLAFNWYQERAHRRRAEEAFEAPPRDVLFDGDAPPPPLPVHGEPDERLSDFGAETETPAQPEPAPAPRTAPRQPEPAQSQAEPGAVDCEAVFQQEEPFGEDFLQRLARAMGTLSRHAHPAGFEERTGQWVPLDETASGRFRRIRLSMQLADRQSAVSRADLEEFCAAMRGVSDDTAAGLILPDLDALEARAQELDRFCADVDIAIGLSVVARTGQLFQGTTIRALAESAGLKLEADGQFHYEDSHGASLFTLDNQDPEPFFPESIKALTTSGVTFLLDVPRAAGGIGAYDRMVQVSRNFAAKLDGIIVDDNRQALNDHGLDAIRRHLLGVYGAMDQAGIPPGGPVALRLFS